MSSVSPLPSFLLYVISLLREKRISLLTYLTDIRIVSRQPANSADLHWPGTRQNGISSHSMLIYGKLLAVPTGRPRCLAWYSCSSLWSSWSSLKVLFHAARFDICRNVHATKLLPRFPIFLVGTRGSNSDSKREN